MSGYILRRGGGTGKVFGVIVVNYPEGASCSCPGSVSKLAVSSTKCIFGVPEAGTYRVVATLGPDMSDDHVDISAESLTAETFLSFLVPSEYRAVEYLGSSGTQYIELSKTRSGYDEIVPSTDFSIEMEASGGGSASGTTPNPIFGINGFTADCTYTNDKFTLYDGTNASWTSGTPSGQDDIPFGTKVSLSYAHSELIGGLEFSVNSSKASIAKTSITTPTRFHLFAYNGSRLYVGTNRIYSCKIRDGGTLVAELYPCVRRSDNVAGFWDKVQEFFLTNDGSGVFSVGNYI